MERKLIYKQRDLKDCGVCCLASIIEYYDGYVPLELLREQTLTNLSGTTAYHLINTAKILGFDAIGLKLDNLNDHQLILPAIAHVTLSNGLNHYLVIYKITKTKVTLMDPGCGKKIMAIEDFNKIWNNIIINLYPKSKILKLDKTHFLFSLIKASIKENRKIFTSLVFCSILFTLVSIILNYYYEISFGAINTINKDSLNRIILIFGFLTFFKVLIMYLKDYYELYLNKNLDLALSKKFINHTLNLPLNSAKSRTSGEIMSRFHDLEQIKYMISDIVISLFLDTTLAVVSALLLYRINKKLFLVLFVVLTIYSIISFVFNRISYHRALNNINEETEYNAEMLEKIENIESIKNTNSIKTFSQKMILKGIRFYKDSFDFSKLYSKQNLVKNFMSEFGLYIITSYAFILIMDNQLSITNFMTFNAFIVYLFNPIKNTLDLLPKYNYIKAITSKLNEYLSISTEDIKESQEIFKIGDIHFQNVTYSPNKYNNVIKNSNLLIKHGAKVFLKGPSGSGKSTICKLLFRIIKPDKGNISIGGVNIADYQLDTIRSNITYVSQNEQLFHDTLKNNLDIQNNCEISTINEILEICELKSIVEKLPLRLENILVKDANNISGGERQRIILARALLQNKQILILDEALSEVGYNQEKRIIKKIFAKYSDKTIIYVSHKNLSYLFNQTIEVGEHNN